MTEITKVDMSRAGLCREIDELRNALRFYHEGFEQSMETFRDGHTIIYVPSDKLKKDCGETARHALGLPNPAGRSS